MRENMDYTPGKETDKQTNEREERAQALAEKWDKVMKKADPIGYERQYPQGEENIAMLTDFLIEPDEALALEILSTQEMVILDGCDDLSAVVDLLEDIKEFLGDDPLAEELFNSDLPDAMEEEARKQENGHYRYYSTQRPIDLGTYPNAPGNKPVAIENFDSRILTDNGNLLAWGYLEYAKPLTEEQYRNYELKPAFTSRDLTAEREERRSVLAELRFAKNEKERETVLHKKNERMREETL